MTVHISHLNHRSVQTVDSQPRLNRLVVGHVCVPDSGIRGGPKQLRDGSPRISNPAELSRAAEDDRHDHDQEQMRHDDTDHGCVGGPPQGSDDLDQRHLGRWRGGVKHDDSVVVGNRTQVREEGLERERGI